MEHVRRYACSAMHDAAPGMTLRSKLIAVFRVLPRTNAGRVALRFLLMFSVLDSAAAGLCELCTSYTLVGAISASVAGCSARGGLVCGRRRDLVRCASRRRRRSVLRRCTFEFGM
jgi:hypothetical protein